jgi:hypothetical protein
MLNYLTPLHNCEVIVHRKGYYSSIFTSLRHGNDEKFTQGDSTQSLRALKEHSPILGPKERRLLWSSRIFSYEYGMGLGYREAIHQRSLYTDEITEFAGA